MGSSTTIALSVKDSDNVSETTGKLTAQSVTNIISLAAWVAHVITANVKLIEVCKTVVVAVFSDVQCLFCHALLMNGNIFD